MIGVGKVLNEGLLFIVLGFWSITEGVRLFTKVRRTGFFDVLGPDFYNLGVGVGLVITGTIYILFKNKIEPKKPIVEREGWETQDIVKLLGVVGSMILYVILITTIGYLLATAIFFLFINKIFGSKSWLINILLSTAMAVVYKIVFADFFRIHFPRGFLDIDIGVFFKW